MFSFCEFVFSSWKKRRSRSKSLKHMLCCLWIMLSSFMSSVSMHKLAWVKKQLWDPNYRRTDVSENGWLLKVGWYSWILIYKQFIVVQNIVVWYLGHVARVRQISGEVDTIRSGGYCPKLLVFFDKQNMQISIVV